MQSMKTRQRLEHIHAHAAFRSAIKVLTRLQSLGFSAVFAGGGVRDALMGITPKDLDIATAAPPDDVERAFERTLAVGKAFGTIVVIEDGHNFEVTTFRKEGPYYDGRHPSAIEFTDMKEDAARRDFTVNALFYDPSEMSVLDFVGGVADLELRRLRTVGVAEERFAEDRLRMLRAIRFVAQLGFDLEESAVQAIRKHGAQLGSVSAERILNEVKRQLASSHLSKSLYTLKESELYKYFWPELSTLKVERIEAFPAFHSWENAFAALMVACRPSLLERGAVDAIVRESEARLRAWKASRESQRRVVEQIRAVHTLLTTSSKAQRLRTLGGDGYADILVLAAGVLAQQEQREKLDVWRREYLSVATPEGGLPLPLLNGQDFISLGVEPGARLGELIKGLYDAQLEGRIQSEAQARDWIRAQIKV
ncbi:MAG: hypothetical protein KF799_11440 [Bdellovibrionales bacterium]|nr:hypothetical protein [Bdellovibrionales bacterium]